jgi:hypothetical protein
MGTKEQKIELTSENQSVLFIKLKRKKITP